MKNFNINYFYQYETKKTKIRNAFANNMSADAKLNKAQIFKIIQFGGSFGSWLGNLG